MLGVLGRMALEVFFFRSLFRNLKTQMNDGPRITYGEAKWLWLAGMAFHYSFLCYPHPAPAVLYDTGA